MEFFIYTLVESGLGSYVLLPKKGFGMNILIISQKDKGRDRHIKVKFYPTQRLIDIINIAR
jgi:hypothetical protein